MRFRPSHFDRFIDSIGQDVEWRHSYACACVNPETGSPDHKHALCKGKGRIWDPPVLTVAGVPSQNTTLKLITAGLWQNGDMTLTLPRSSPMWASAGVFDRVTLLNSTDPFSMPMKRGAPSERLLFKVSSLERVFWLHPTTREPVEGSLPTVDADGHLIWGPDGAPPPGVAYSLTGQMYSEYFIFDHLPSDRNQHHGVQLPKKVQLRRWDLFGR